MNKMHNTSCNPFVSVIIPVRDDTERLKKCLSALKDQTYPIDKYEIIVVDNGSKKDPVVDITPFEGGRLEYEQRRGSYAARNKGIRLSRGEVLAFTDSDCIPQHDWIERGVTALLRVPGTVYVSGRIEIFFKDQEKLNSIEMLTAFTMFDQEENKRCKNFGVTANIFTYKRVFDQVGLFNPDLISGGDLEWGNRVIDAGYDLLYAEDVCVKHLAISSLKHLYKREMRLVYGHYQTGRLKSITAHDLLRVIRRSVIASRVIWSNKMISETVSTRTHFFGIFIIFFISECIWLYGRILIKFKLFKYFKNL